MPVLTKTEEAVIYARMAELRGTEAWACLRGLVENMIRSETENLIALRGPEAMDVLRGKIIAMRWVLNLPEEWRKK